MGFDAKDILAKAKQNAEEKAAQAEAEARAAKEAEEKRRAEEAAMKAAKEKEDAQRRERERLEREEAERRRAEEAKREREEKERREAENRKQIEIEKARVQEEIRQKEIREKEKAVQECGNKMQSLIPDMNRVLNNKKAEIWQVREQIKSAKELLNNSIDYSKINCLNEYKDTVSKLEDKLYKLQQKEAKKESRKKFFKVFFIVVAIVAVCGGIVKCSMVQKAKGPVYKVGKKGQGGIVFYDKGEYSDGWRYLEVADVIYEKIQFSPQPVTVTDVKTNVGGGDFNTKALYATFGNDCAAWAAVSCEAGGKTDWYLGNEEEYKILYNTLMEKKKLRKKAEKNMDSKLYTTFSNYLGGKVYSYLASNPNSNGKVKAVIFSDNKMFLEGGTTANVEYDWTEYTHKDFPGYITCVRPIRKF